LLTASSVTVAMAARVPGNRDPRETLSQLDLAHLST
jgi:hypothetical protein